jgi:hypothetical protein
MAAIEHETTSAFPVPRPASERAIFVAEGDHRARRLRFGAALALVFALLWLAGLAIGMLGLGELPDLSLPIPGRDTQPSPAERANQVEPAAPQGVPAHARAAQKTERPEAIRAVQRSTAPRRRPHRSGPAFRARTRAPAPTRRLTPSPVPQVQAPANPTPPPVRQGLVRRGLTSPPGEARQATRPQPPATPPGHARRADAPPTTTTPVETVPLPAGAQKPDKPPPKA